MKTCGLPNEAPAKSPVTSAGATLQVRSDSFPEAATGWIASAELRLQSRLPDGPRWTVRTRGANGEGDSVIHKNVFLAPTCALLLNNR